MTSTPEYLDLGSGGPLEPARGGARRTALVVAAVGGTVLIGAGAWAAWSFLATGAQPAEALPDSTVAYVSIDLDPSGGQKIAAFRTLDNFPAFDELGLNADDDIRKWIFERAQDVELCPDLDFGDDVEPWLGDRFAGALVDTGGDFPDTVLVVQVKDEDAADAGLTKVRDCAGEDAAWSIADGWALVGESQDVVDRVADAASDSTLADDGDFTHWTGEAGDPGIAALYLAPEAGELLAEQLDDGFGFGLPGLSEGFSDDSSSSADTAAYHAGDGTDDLAGALKDFKGAAATIRFDDGGLEVEAAGDSGASSAAFTSSDRAGETISTLPADTAFAVGLAFGEGWFSDLVEQFADASGDSVDSVLEQLSEETGLDLPADAEALVGDSLALAVGPDFDAGGLFWEPDEDTDTDEGLQAGLKVTGDVDGIEAAIDNLIGTSEADGWILDRASSDDAVVVGPNADYNEQLVEDGGLGDADSFRRVVEHAEDASAVVYVDFDAGWLAKFFDDDENLEPLDALGLSAWLDDDVVHGVLKVTSD